MKALVLGGDGYCGWPISLRLSARGHDVVIVDNGSRRQIDDEIGAESLIPIASLEARIGAWRNANGAEIRSKSIDISVDFQGLIDLLGEFRPDVIIHLAEQRSVPYAMDSRAGGLYTMRNNLMGTTHLLEAMLATGSEAHLVHLGSIGVYGYETLGYEIPEGYQTVRRVMADGALAPAESILHPFNPVSKYHLTKALDHLCLAYYASAHGVRATDLHQGTVWGAETAETTLDPRLANRFDYDSVYGTVLNRYAVQAAMGLPLSVYGSGGQTR
ncbi:MAG: NAD-dependent epimerase/dehydratase family protein, partial [Pseudomonadota bacterium]